jgi:hypothetical protein
MIEILLGLIAQVDLFPIVYVQTTGLHRYQKRCERNVVPLLSTRNLNENGEPISDLYSTISSSGSVTDLRYRNKTETTHDDNEDDDDCDGRSVMSSVTHWSDIMRQDSAWLNVHGDNISSSLHNTAVTAAATTNTPSTTATSKRLDDTSTLTQTDLDQIEQYWNRLMPTVNYLGTVQVAQIYKALQVAYQAHRGQMRKSGEPFIIHVS